jgi:glutaredoxin
MSEATSPQITLYRTSWCAFCHTEMQWLDRMGIPYVAKDIEADQSAHDELMKKIGGDFRGVPVTDVGGDIVLGFDRPKLQEAMAKHNITPAASE